jgi:catechol 2,3-dioxygenase-like lactoylglutathione lyase family enzyme
MARFLYTMCRITDPERSRRFYEALGFTFAGDFDIVRDGQLEATNYFFSIGDQESVLELTFNHDGRTYTSAAATATSRSASTTWTGRWLACASRGSNRNASRTRWRGRLSADVRQRPR